MTRREWAWVAAVAALIVAASTVPYLAGTLAQTPQERFGGVVMNPVDYHSHLAKMWQGYRGQWRYRLLFTSEDHAGVFVQTFYVALGHLARLFGLGLPPAFQIARVVCGCAMLASAYRFIAHFVARVRTRQVAFLLATVASGLGWLTEAVAPTPPGGVSPMDFWLSDGFTYLALLTSPHFCAAVALLLSVFLLLLRRPERPTLGVSALAVLASLVLGMIHPYAMLLADLLPVLYWAVEWLRMRRVAWRGLATVAAMGVAQLPLLIYDLWVFRQPVFVGWSEQNVTLSPPPNVYLWGYGVLLALGVVGAVVWVRRREWRVTFPLLWVGLVAVLAYVPWNLQRRFLEGVQVPMGLLAGVGLAEGLLPLCSRRMRIRWCWLGMALIVALAPMSNLYLTASLTWAATADEPSMFRSADLLAAVDWLGENSAWEETVLSGFNTGNLIPARIGHRVVLGHWMETVDYAEKRAAVARFYEAQTSDAQRQELLEMWGVAYVFHGAEERALGDFDPAATSWLEPAFRSGEVAVYRVLLEG
ncbi:MAG: hypothetical protein JXA14_06920 [Anaerolineae bacterium]|nr:hypothetical protein [Anaerolineae bacterium]